MDGDYNGSHLQGMRWCDASHTSHRWAYLGTKYRNCMGLTGRPLVHHEFNSRILLLARNQAGRHWVTQKPSVGQELPIPLLALLASATSADTLQELNPQPWLRKALVYHSATSAVVGMHVGFLVGVPGLVLGSWLLLTFWMQAASPILQLARCC